jgi:hypothetical protein
MSLFRTQVELTVVQWAVALAVVELERHWRLWEARCHLVPPMLAVVMAVVLAVVWSW